MESGADENIVSFFHVEQARERLQNGLGVCLELNLVPQWWAFRLTIHLLSDLWQSSFHQQLPRGPNLLNAESWRELRDLFIAILQSRARAEIELWPSQLEGAARAVDHTDDLVVSLPTSAGKTRIAELCILRCLSLGKRVVFVTPLRALSAQTEANLQRTFVPLGKSISTLYGSIGSTGFDEDTLSERDIVVATPEKLDFALRNDTSLIEDVGLIVLDEGHMIGPGEREVRYEVQIQRLLKRPDADQRRIVCLSAILPEGSKLDDFVRWLRRDHPGEVVQNDWRPTRLRYGEIRWRGEHARLDVSVGNENSWVEKFLEAKIPLKGKRKKHFPCDQRELCLATAWRLIEDGQSVLIYCPERRSVDPFASAIVDLNQRGVLSSVLLGDGAQLSTALSIGKEWLGGDHPILECLKLGVAIHHGALPTPFRKEIERLLRDGALRLTISSPTLAQGLNLSATCIIFYGLIRNRARIDASEFKNVVGRAGRAYVDVEGFVLYPMFDRIESRRWHWRDLTSDVKGRELESGLVLLVIALLQRMIKKLRVTNTDEVIDYVMNNTQAWEFPKLADEIPEDATAEKRRWQQHIASLDTAILSLLGDQEIQDAEIENKLDEILSSSLWDRHLRHRRKESQRAIKSGLIARARFIWARSTPSQRRGYFLAGVGLDTGRQLDAIAPTANELLVQANGAVLTGDADLAVSAITALARQLFAIPPFIPEPLPSGWKQILKAWLLGNPVADTSVQDSDTLQFIEGGLIYRLPWGMEALRVRALANQNTLGGGMTLNDFELRLAVPAVETGTLHRSAAILMQAGFTPRLAAIKAVQDAQGVFETARELAVWLRSKEVEQLSGAADWPTSETAKMWREFRESYAPRAARIWKKSSLTAQVHWNEGIGPVTVGTALRLWDEPESPCTSVFSADFELIGTLRRKLNPSRCGLTIATVGPDPNGVTIKYFGPNDLMAA